MFLSLWRDLKSSFDSKSSSRNDLKLERHRRPSERVYVSAKTRECSYTDTHRVQSSSLIKSILFVILENDLSLLW